MLNQSIGSNSGYYEKKQEEYRITKTEKDLIFINYVNTCSNYLNRLLINDYPLEYTSKALSEFGLESHRVYCCFVIQLVDSMGNAGKTDPCEGDTAEIKQQVLIWLADKGHDKIWYIDNKIILLVSLADETISTKQYQLDFAHQLTQEIKKRFPALRTTIGISGSSSIPFNVKDVYEKANHAAIVASADSRPQIVHFDDIGLYEIAFQLIKDTNIVTLAASTIGRLVKYDQHREGNLLLTLKYILEGDSLKVVAKKLYIHPNTALWRKHRIEELLQMSLDKMETKVTLMLHLKIWELQHKTALEKKS
ncbi:PucR family transcriptional regulator [Sporomusa ovata]|uniref:PucR family transcriptional regulator n=1 Tax=Sporomusa ovata TaxID=2378 RepID=UPI002165E90F|nr:helix-turn-helix domain-containing protein [Sporomusa ovata]